MFGATCGCQVAAAAVRTTMCRSARNSHGKRVIATNAAKSASNGGTPPQNVTNNKRGEHQQKRDKYSGSNNNNASANFCAGNHTTNHANNFKCEHNNAKSNFISASSLSMSTFASSSSAAASSDRSSSASTSSSNSSCSSSHHNHSNNQHHHHRSMAGNGSGGHGCGSCNSRGRLATFVPTPVVYALPGLLAVLCYLNSLGGDFVHDDVMAVSTNRDVVVDIDGGRGSIVDVFRDDFWGKPMCDNTSHKSYRPLTILTFRWNFFIGGLESFGFHLSNILLHLFVVLLFVNLLRHHLRWPNHVTLLSSLLMAAHPIHTEAVSGIVGRADVLACALSLLSFLAYARCIKEHQFGKPGCRNLFPDFRLSLFFYGSLALASLAMLAKEHGVTTLGIVACYDVFLSEKIIRRIFGNCENWAACTPLLARLTMVAFTTLVLVSFRIWMLDGAMPVFSEQDNPTSFAPKWETRFLTYSYLVAFNSWLLLNPSTLSYDWQMGSIPPIDSLYDLRNLSTVVLAAGVLLLSWKAFSSQEENERRVLCLSLLFTIFPFLPASNLFVTVGFVVAERILYFPSVGFCILVAHGAFKLYAFRKWRRVVVASAVLLVVLFALKTVRRNWVWNSRESLFRSGLESLPHNAKMHYNFANLQNDQGNVQDAIKHYKETLRLWPDHASAHNNLGTLVEDPLVAKFHFMEAIRINPVHARAHFNMGNLLSKEGQMSTAIRFMEQAVALEPTYTDAYTNMAAMYSEVGRLEEAERTHNSLLKWEPDNADVHNNYGAFLQKLGRFDDSLRSYRRAIELQADHLVALVNTAKLLRSIKKNREAEELYKRALDIKEDPKIMDSLGVLYLNTGRFAEARKIFEDVLKNFPDEMDPRVHFAQVLTHEQNFQQAEEMLHWVTTRNATHRNALRQMALLCNHRNRTTEALGYILRALKLCSVSDVTCAQLYADHANILMDMDHMDLAAESYKMALQIYPSFTLAHLNLGVIYHIKRDFPLAWQHYKTAQVLEPSNRLLQENMDKLRKAEVALMNVNHSEHPDSFR